MFYQIFNLSPGAVIFFFKCPQFTKVRHQKVFLCMCGCGYYTRVWGWGWVCVCGGCVGVCGCVCVCVCVLFLLFCLFVCVFFFGVDSPKWGSFSVQKYNLFKAEMC